ncbi:MAG: T9SS type A sorting domain-containing protein [Cytophagales bacterium]|nr:T9SS type A sorting domain-containing protein [Cytophagales bacterium]
MKTLFSIHQKQRLFCALCLVLLCICLPVRAAVIYVNASATGANNGTSWVNAYTGLQSALAAAASGDEIWVAAGVYKPSVQVDVDGSGGSDAREVTFRIPNGVKVYGGFAGTEALLTERNWTTNLTILSGDIDNNDANSDGNFIAETAADIVGNNAYHVVYTQNVTAATWLDGCIITAGRAWLAAPPNPNVPNLDGGGWYNKISAPANASSPTILNCTFRGNYAESEGAGFYTTPGTVFVTMESVIRSCKFISNQSNNTGGAVFLGSFVKGNYRPILSQCEFTDNQALRRGGALAFVGDSARVDTCTFRLNRTTAVAMGVTLPGSGGGVSMVASKTSFRRCMFIGNSATGNATGAFEGGGGGAVYMSTNEPQTNTLGESKPVFIGCGFYQNSAGGNTAAWGGAAVHLNDAGILKVKYINCVFSGNSAEDDGGAVANFTRVISPPSYTPLLDTDFTNCTFRANTAGRYGGGLYNDGYVSDGVEVLSVRVENSILYGNTAVTSGPQIRNEGNVATVAYSLVQGSGGSGGGWNATVGTDGTNNIDSNPNFVNAADPDGADNQPGTSDDGLRVQSTSLVVNAGNSTAADLAGIATDFAGEARLQGARVDMGAYERTSLIIINPKIYWLYHWRLLRPQCLSCPWAIRLVPEIRNPKPQNFVWTGLAQLIDYGDSAVVQGRIVSQTNRAIQFDVYLKLIKPQAWKSWSALRRTYNFETPEAEQVALKNHQDWTYWEVSEESYLEGKARVKGKLKLRHAPDSRQTGFQLGIGANAQDADFGLSGEFFYEGTVAYKGKKGWEKIQTKGAGSLNVDAKECQKYCDTRSARLDAEDESLLEEATLLIYPNPARESVTVEWIGTRQMYQVQVFNFQGQQLRPRITTDGANRQMVHTQGFAPGLYYLRIQSEDGQTQQHKVIVQE